jgi:peptidoglycan/LPS O-acetylase OafA/YrhL
MNSTVDRAVPSGALGGMQRSSRHSTSTAGPTGSTSYRPDIDGLRAIAVLAVVAFHVAPKRVTGGFVGVDVFFVISGFLISSIILSQGRSGSFSFSTFYIRRVRRIIPSLLLVLLSTLVAGWFLLLPDELAQLGKHVVAGLLFVSNLQLWTEAGYFDAASELKPLLHLWSLGVEEQFYLVWPVLLTGVASKKGRATRWVAVLTVASFALCLLLAQRSPSAAFYLPFSRFWQLSAGALLAARSIDLGSNQERDAPPWLAHAASWLGLVLIVVAIATFDFRTRFPELRALVPTVASMLLIAAGPRAHVNTLLLSRKPVVFVGLVSYPLYLWHWPPLAYLDIVQPPGVMRNWRLAAAGLAGLAAVATYLFIEKPVRAAGTLRWRGIATGGLVGVALGALVVLRAGFAEERGPWKIAAIAMAPDATPMQTEACLDAHGGLFAPRVIPDRDFCTHPRISSSGSPVTVLGDSHANRLFLGLRAVDSARSYRNVGRGSCVPFVGFDGRVPETGADLLCQPTVQNLLSGIAAPSNGVVIVHGYFLRAYNGTFRPAEEQDLRVDAAQTFRVLAPNYRRVIAVLDVPVMNFMPASCVPRPALRELARVPCGVPAAEWAQAVANTNAQIRAAATEFANVEVFDPATVLCDQAECGATKDGELLYMDSHHLSQAGAELVGRALLTRIEAAGQAEARSIPP